MSIVIDSRSAAAIICTKVTEGIIVIFVFKILITITCYSEKLKVCGSPVKGNLLLVLV
jgi:hypothetical protein